MALSCPSLFRMLSSNILVIILLLLFLKAKITDNKRKSKNIVFFADFIP